jgi:hypothetical protein
LKHQMVSTECSKVNKKRLGVKGVNYPPLKRWAS